MIAMMKMQLRMLLRSKKVWTAAFGTIALIGIAIAAAMQGENVNALESFKASTRIGLFGLLGYGLPFLFSSGLIGEDVEARTLSFLITRPTPRTQILLGKMLAGLSFSLGIALIATLVLFFGTLGGDAGQHFDLLGKVVLGLIGIHTAYASISLFWSVLIPEASGIASLIHFAVIEFLFDFKGGGAAYLSLNGMLKRAIGLIDAETVSTTVASSAWGLEILVFLGLALFTFGSQEYRFRAH